MSFLDKIKAGASVVATAATEIAKITAEATVQTYNQLKATPTRVQCSGCSAPIEVPADAWHWRCEAGHENADVKACATCNSPKPKIPPPSVTCEACKAVTVCSSTVIMESLRNAPVNAKKAVVEGVGQVKRDVAELRAAPTEFKCTHCQTLLSVPKVPWQCQTCNFRNTPESERCSSCQQNRLKQKVLCGVCRRSTPVPTSNFERQMLETAHATRESAKVLYFKASKASFAPCPRCQTNISFATVKKGEEGAETHQVPASVGCPNCGAEVPHPHASEAAGFVAEQAQVEGAPMVPSDAQSESFSAAAGGEQPQLSSAVAGLSLESTVPSTGDGLTEPLLRNEDSAAGLPPQSSPDTPASPANTPAVN